MRHALLSMLLLLVAVGCTNRGGYLVESTAVFEDGGRRSSQTIVFRCGVYRYTIGESLYSQREGDQHFLARRDGSLLLVSEFDPCETTPPPVGTPVEVRADSGLLFNSAFRPARASDMWISGDAAAPSGPRLLSISARRAPDSAAETRLLAQAFPSQPTRVSGRDLQDWPLLEDDRWLAIQAHVWRLRGSRCTAGDGAPVLVEGDASRDFCGARDLCQGDLYRRCREPVESLAAAPDPRLALIRLSPPAAGWHGPTLWSASALRAQGAPTARSGDHTNWAPEACIGSICRRFGSMDSRMMVWDPVTATVTVLSIDSGGAGSRAADERGFLPPTNPRGIDTPPGSSAASASQVEAPASSAKRQ